MLDLLVFFFIAGLDILDWLGLLHLLLGPIDRVLLEGTWLLVFDKAVVLGPVFGNDAVVVRLTVVCQPKRLLLLAILVLLLMEDVHGFRVISINLYRPVVYFTHRLNFYVVTPYAILLLLLHILLNFCSSSLDEGRKVVFFGQNILHAPNSHHPMLLLVAISLVGY